MVIDKAIFSLLYTDRRNFAAILTPETRYDIKESALGSQFQKERGFSMRTLLARTLDVFAHTHDGESHFGYKAGGTITFICEGTPDTREMANFRHEIRTAYKQSPWRQGPNGSLLASEIEIDEGVSFVTDPEAIAAPLRNSPTVIPATRGCRFKVALANGHNGIEKCPAARIREAPFRTRQNPCHAETARRRLRRKQFRGAGPHHPLASPRLNPTRINVSGPTQ